MGTPSLCKLDEGRWDGSEQPTSEDPSGPRGIGRSTHAHIDGQHGRPAVVSRGNRAAPGGRRQESEGRIEPLSPVKAGGGKAPWFEVRLDEKRAGRLA